MKDLISRVDDAIEGWDEDVLEQLLEDCRAALLANDAREAADQERWAKLVAALDHHKARADAAVAREKKALADVAALSSALAAAVEAIERATHRGPPDGLEQKALRLGREALATTSPGEGWASPAEVESWRESFRGLSVDLGRSHRQRDAAETLLNAHIDSNARLEAERDAAVARVKELEVQREVRQRYGDRMKDERDQALSALAATRDVGASLVALSSSDRDEWNRLRKAAPSTTGWVSPDTHKAATDALEHLRQKLMDWVSREEHQKALSAVAAARAALKEIAHGCLVPDGALARVDVDQVDRVARAALRQTESPSTTGWVPPDQLEALMRQAWEKGCLVFEVAEDLALWSRHRDADIAELLKGGGR